MCLFPSHDRWAGVRRDLNRKERTGNQTHLKNTAIKLGIDFSHFTGKAWNKGQTFEKKRHKIIS